MKRLFTLLTAVCFTSLLSFGQVADFGVGVGASNFIGDLGKKETAGKSYFSDIEASLFRPAIGVYYRNAFNYHVSMKASFTYGRLAGNDKLAQYENFKDNAWFRNYRNLHFKSHVAEFAVTGEVNLLKYVVGSTHQRFTPYVMGGLGLFHFDPKAEYEGEWVRLQPLGTEGQGMPDYPERKKYKLVQPSIPVGLGVKYNVSKYITVSVEVGHRYTFTDYIDDVSTTYPDKDAIYSYYGEERADLVYHLSRRSPEIDTEGTYNEVTAAGEYRGNPGGNDAYLFSMVSVSYNLSKVVMDWGNPFAKRRLSKYKRVFVK